LNEASTRRLKAGRPAHRLVPRSSRWRWSTFCSRCRPLRRRGGPDARPGWRRCGVAGTATAGGLGEISTPVAPRASPPRGCATLVATGEIRRVRWPRTVASLPWRPFQSVPCRQTGFRAPVSSGPDRDKECLHAPGRRMAPWINDRTTAGGSVEGWQVLDHARLSVVVKIDQLRETVFGQELRPAESGEGKLELRDVSPRPRKLAIR
jgi:hypothetical protein